MGHFRLHSNRGTLPVKKTNGRAAGQIQAPFLETGSSNEKTRFPSRLQHKVLAVETGLFPTKQTRRVDRISLSAFPLMTSFLAVA